jgi:hypothetical protein
MTGNGTAFEESLVKYAAEFKKKNIDSGFETLVGRMGTEMPFYMWIERYKDPIDMFTTRERIFTELGFEIQKIWQEMQKHIRKMEIKTGWFRPDLSYIPSK